MPRAAPAAPAAAGRNWHTAWQGLQELSDPHQAAAQGVQLARELDEVLTQLSASFAQQRPNGSGKPQVELLQHAAQVTSLSSLARVLRTAGDAGRARQLHYLAQAMAVFSDEASPQVLLLLLRGGVTKGAVGAMAKLAALPPKERVDNHHLFVYIAATLVRRVICIGVPALGTVGGDSSSDSSCGGGRDSSIIALSGCAQADVVLEALRLPQLCDSLIVWLRCLPPWRLRRDAALGADGNAVDAVEALEQYLKRWLPTTLVVNLAFAALTALPLPERLTFWRALHTAHALENMLTLLTACHHARLDAHQQRMQQQQHQMPQAAGSAPPLATAHGDSPAAAPLDRQSDRDDMCAALCRLSAELLTAPEGEPAWGALCATSSKASSLACRILTEPRAADGMCLLPQVLIELLQRPASTAMALNAPELKQLLSSIVTLHLGFTASTIPTTPPAQREWLSALHQLHAAGSLALLPASLLATLLPAPEAAAAVAAGAAAAAAPHPNMAPQVFRAGQLALHVAACSRAADRIAERGGLQAPDGTPEQLLSLCQEVLAVRDGSGRNAATAAAAAGAAPASPAGKPDTVFQQRCTAALAAGAALAAALTAGRGSAPPNTASLTASLDALMTELRPGLSVLTSLSRCCSGCGACPLVDDRVRLSACGRCGVAEYHDKECQRLHWRNSHKSECAGMRRAAEGAVAEERRMPWAGALPRELVSAIGLPAMLKAAWLL